MPRLTPRLAAVGVAALAGGLLARRRARQFDRGIDRRVGELVAATEPRTGTVTAEDVDALPAPIRRYANRALADEQPLVQRARLRQHGAFRLGSGWHAMRATQWVTTRPPAFLWDATIDVAPLLSIRVVDRYLGGAGILEARVRSLVPVARAGPGHAMNEGELLRYLAEAVWYPTVLVDGEVEWEPLDADSARATLRDDSVTATATFHVGDDDTVERVTGRRYRQEDDAYGSWIGRFGEYERHAGVLVPTSGEVGWATPAGEEPYWRATLDDVAYTMARA